MLNKRQKIRVLFVFIWMMVLFFLIYKKNKESFSMKYDFSATYNPFISTLRPDSRVGIRKKDEKGKWHQTLKSQPVYFDMETPGNFTKAELKLKYKNKNQEDLKIGILADEKDWNYKLYPVENQKIDKLLGEWYLIREGNMILLQRNKKFETFTAFLKNLPSREEIGLYNYELKGDFISRDNISPGKFLLPCPLKGYHQFYIYVRNEPLYLSFAFDPKSDGTDGMINIYDNKNGLIESKRIDKKTLPKVEISKTDFQEGIYKVEIKVNSGFILRNFEANIDGISFIDNIHLYPSEKDKKVKLYADSPYLDFSTASGPSLQTIEVQNKKLNLAEVYKQYAIENYGCEKISALGQSYCLAEIKLKEGDIIIQSAGKISFVPAQFINPEYKKFEHLKNLEGVNYIVADYKSPTQEDGWEIGTVSFDLANIKRNKNKYGFILSALGMDEAKTIELYEISAEFWN